MSKPSLNSVEAGELPISSEALFELLNAVISKGLPFRFMAKGLSMFPFIRDGDVITVSPLNRSLPSIGDVVAFNHPLDKRIVVHRVVGRSTKGYLIIKGDNVKKPDGNILINYVVGRVSKVQRNGRRVFLGLGKEKYLIALFSRLGLRFSSMFIPYCILRNIIRRFKTWMNLK